MRLLRYLAKVAAGDDKKEIVDQSQREYQKAFEISKKRTAANASHQIGCGP